MLSYRFFLYNKINGVDNMSRIKFSLNDIEILSKNEYVLKVSEKSIIYTDEFKALVIAESLNGKTPPKIFRNERPQTALKNATPAECRHCISK